MFVINQNSSQELFINLSNEVSNDYYLFVLSGGVLESEKKFFANETSEYPERFSKFTIEENTTEDLLNGIISLPSAGDVIVQLYNTVSQSFTIPEELEPVWRGLFRVVGNEILVEGNEPTIEIKGYDPTR